MTNNCGLYVHIPFCLSKCIYCDFLSFANKQDKYEEYVAALEIQAKSYSAKTKNKVFDTVYFGGGTPSILPAFLIEKIVYALKENFNILPNAERTIEVNPATVDEEKAIMLKSLGFNRVSIGMQSNDECLLKFLGRVHNVKQFEETVKILKNAGFDNINADFIMGLPTQTKKTVVDTVKYLNDLGLSHISAYSLILERGTPLSKMVSRGKVRLPDDDFVVELYDAFVCEAEKYGFYRYEVSNFAKIGKEARHNENCWKYREYMGLGLGAQSFMFGRRFTAVKNLDNYIKKLHDGKSVVSHGKKLSVGEQISEYIMLGLRLEKGIDIVDFFEMFDLDFLGLYGNIIERLKNQNIVSFDGRHLKVKKDKFYILNSIITEFII